jgi:hypothetical protein
MIHLLSVEQRCILLVSFGYEMKFERKLTAAYGSLSQVTTLHELRLTGKRGTYMIILGQHKVHRAGEPFLLGPIISSIMESSVPNVASEPTVPRLSTPHTASTAQLARTTYDNLKMGAYFLTSSSISVCISTLSF